MTRKSPRARLRGPLCLASWLLVGGACTHQVEDGPPVRLAGRLIEVEPTVDLDYDWAGPRTTTRAWDFQAAQENKGWELIDGGRWTDAGLAVEAPRARLRNTSGIAARSVSALVLELDDPESPCAMRIAWGRGPKPSIADSPPLAEKGSTLRVDLATHPEWVDTIDDLRIVIRKCSGERALRVLLEAPPDDGDALALPADLPAAWKVTLDQDTRSAVIAPPGTVHRWAITGDVDRGEVRFAFGAFGRPPALLDFDLRYGEGGDERSLGTFSLSPRDWDDRPGWREVAVPISGLTAGGELSITTGPEGPWPILDSVPVLAAPKVVRGSGGRPNVLLISIDTLRADHLSLYGYPRETTPNLDRRARESGIVFRNVVAPAGWTLPSHVSMFSGLNTLRHGVNFATLAPPSVRMVAQDFGDAGYQTAAFVAGGYVSSAFGLSRGFDSFRTRRGESPSAATSKLELEDGIEQLDRWLDDGPREPFFAFFHTYEVHAPFWARSPYFEQFGGDRTDVPRGFGSTSQREDAHRFVIPVAEGELKDGDPQVITSLYDSGIAYMDHQLERIFDRLEAAGLADDTIVVLTSDHGEALLEHGFAGHGPAHDEIVLVPLIVWPAGGSPHRAVEEQVQLVDLAPTLLDLAGIDRDRSFDGATLMPLIDGVGDYPQRPAYIHAGTFGIAVRLANRAKYILHRAPWDYFGAGEELFDLRADPGEFNDLSKSDSERLASTRTALRAALDEQLPGFLLELDNRGDDTVRLSVASSNNRPSGIDAPGCEELAWHSGQRFVFSLPPGGGCAITLEHLRGSLVRIVPVDDQGDRVPGSPALDLETGALSERSRWIFDSRQWSAAAGDDGGSDDSGVLHLTGGWKAAPAADGDAEAAMDDALVEQLRALGYIE